MGSRFCLADAYGYDAAGRTTSVTSSAGTTTLTYDFESRVTQITGPGINATYSYNGLDTRVGKTENSVANTFRRSGAYVTDPVLSDGTASYTPGVSRRTGTETRYFHTGLKNTDSLTNPSQTVAAARIYDAFGNVISSSGTWSGPFGYAGNFGYQADASGLKLLGHRYYDPSTGRFLTRDPIKDGRNWYAYGAGEAAPTTIADPTGLAKIWLAWTPVFAGTYHLLIIVECERTGKWWVFDAGPRADPRDPHGRKSTRLRGAGRLITDPKERKILEASGKKLIHDDDLSAQHWISTLYNNLPGEIGYGATGIQVGPGGRITNCPFAAFTANSNSWISEVLGRVGLGRPPVPVIAPRYGHRPQQWIDETRKQ